MSRNGSGIYNLPTGNPVVTGTTISSNWANTTLSDISTALTGSVAADGQTPITGDLQMGGNKVTGLGTPTATTDGTTKAYVDTSIATATGTLGTMSTQNANNVAITGGTINGTTIGATTASAVTGTTVTASTQFSGPGTGLTGTAASLTAGNATLSVNSTNAIGYSQTWQNLTSSRAIGTTYTNSTGKPILVNITLNTGSSSATTFTAGGVIVGSISINVSGGLAGQSFIVPNGSTYFATNTAGANSINTWAELR
jgi:hypothetical protein